MDNLPLTIPHRLEVIHRFKDQGGLVAAVLPIHSPRALLRAFGYLPVEVWGPPGVDPGDGAAHLQSYICSIARNIVSFSISGGLKDTDLIFTPHACDSLQGVGSLLIDFIKPVQPVIPFYLPKGKRAVDKAFLKNELLSVYQRLSDITGLIPSEDDMLCCVQREEEADRLLGELHRQRDCLPMSLAELYTLIRAREFLPAEEFILLAQTALDKSEPGTHTHAKRILLSGILPEPGNLLETIESINGWVAGDDLACCGRRLYKPGQSSNPFERMAEGLLSSPPDPMRGSSIAERLEFLLNLSEETGAKGVIFYTVKFCEPELFDLPMLRAGIHEAGLHTLQIEFDINDPLSQQNLTRLEAFLETIQ